MNGAIRYFNTNRLKIEGRIVAKDFNAALVQECGSPVAAFRGQAEVV